MLIAVNMAKAVAELHQIGVVHGDLASENILIGGEGGTEVKLIDFDLSSKVGTMVPAAGNLEFVSARVAAIINQGNQNMESCYANDCYALALCCYLLLGDETKVYLTSLCEDSIEAGLREKMVTAGRYPGKDVLKALIEGNLPASEAAERLDIERRQVIKVSNQ